MDWREYYLATHHVLFYHHNHDSISVEIRNMLLLVRFDDSIYHMIISTFLTIPHVQTWCALDKISLTGFIVKLPLCATYTASPM
jgi:hypothetical protein